MLTTFKVLPKDLEVNLEKLREDIQKVLSPKVRVYKMNEEPIAFGLVALIVHLIIPEDSPDIMEAVEKKINSISGVGEIEVTGMTRL